MSDQDPALQVAFVAGNNGTVHRQSCGNCRYFAALKNVCRKNPPALVTFAVADTLGRQQMQSVGVFPPTTDAEWCGAWSDEAEATFPAVPPHLR